MFNINIPLINAIILMPILTLEIILRTLCTFHLVSSSRNSNLIPVGILQLIFEFLQRFVLEIESEIETWSIFILYYGAFQNIYIIYITTVT